MYKSLKQAIQAAFTPATPSYGSPLAALQGGTASSPDALTPLDRIAQGSMVYNALESILSARQLGILASMYTPALDDHLQEIKVMHCRRVAGSLARSCDVDKRLALDVVFRLSRLEPVGSYAADWTRWLDCSSATVYRRARRVHAEHDRLTRDIYMALRARLAGTGLFPD